MDNDERVILAQRNIAAMNEGMKHFEKMRQADSARVEQLLQTISMLQTQAHKMAVDIAILRAASMGRGPTEGN